MTGQTRTSVPSSSFLARGIEYGLTQAVATLYLLAMPRPERMSLSVIVGWRREWSIILATCWRVTVMLFISFTVLKKLKDFNVLFWFKQVLRHVVSAVPSVVFI